MAKIVDCALQVKVVWGACDLRHVATPAVDIRGTLTHHFDPKGSNHAEKTKIM